MRNPAEAPINNEILKAASQNFYRCLNLQRTTQVLIIADELPKRNPQLRKKLINHSNPNIVLRRKFASLLEYKVREGGNTVASIDFDGEMTEEELQSETIRALKELDQLDKKIFIKRPTTIVYLGESSKNRTVINHAVNDLCHSRSVQVVGLLDSTSEDLHVPPLTNPFLKLNSFRSLLLCHWPFDHFPRFGTFGR